eukprot:3850766-Rhodomonas_salina.4
MMLPGRGRYHACLCAVPEAQEVTELRYLPTLYPIQISAMCPDVRYAMPACAAAGGCGSHEAAAQSVHRAGAHFVRSCSDRTACPVLPCHLAVNARHAWVRGTETGRAERREDQAHGAQGRSPCHLHVRSYQAPMRCPVLT